MILNFEKMSKRPNFECLDREKESKKKKVQAAAKNNDEDLQNHLDSPTSTPVTPNVLFPKKLKKYESYIKEEFINGVKHGICKICTEKIGLRNVKPIPMKDGNTSGVKLHYQAFHPAEFAFLYPASTPVNQKTLSDLFALKESKNRSKLGQEEFDKLTVCWIAYKCLPLQFFDDRVTQNYFQAINSELKYPLRNSLSDKVLP